MFDFDDFLIPAYGTVADAPKPKQKELKEGDYRYKIIKIRKEMVDWKNGTTSPKVIFTLDVEGVVMDGIEIVLSSWKTYLDIIYSFARSIGLSVDHDQRIKWDSLVGREGFAHFIPKKLSRGGTVYNVSEWLEPQEKQEGLDAKEETYSNINNDDFL